MKGTNHPTRDIILKFCIPYLVMGALTFISAQYVIIEIIGV